jgi:hypothetical protein
VNTRIRKTVEWKLMVNTVVNVDIDFKKFEIMAHLSTKYGSPKKSSRPSNDMIYEIIACGNDCRKLSEIIRRSNYRFNNEAIIEALSHKITVSKYEMNTRDISGLMNVFSKARVPPASNDLLKDLLSSLSEAAVWKIDRFSAWDISMTLNAMAKWKIKNDQLFNQAGERAIHIIGTFKAQELSNTSNAFAKLQYYNNELFHHIGAEVIKKIETFNAQNLSNTVCAYSKMNYHHPKLFENVATAAIKIIDTFTAQGLSNMALAYSKMKYRNPWFFIKMGAAAIPIIDTFNPQNLACTASAFARLDHPNPELFNKVASAALSITHEFNSQDLTNIVDAFAKMKHQNSLLFDEVADAAIPIIKTFNAHELSYVASAFAQMKHPHPEFFEAIAIAASQIIDKFKDEELVITVNAFANCDYSHPKFFKAAASQCKPILATFNGQNLSTLLKAFSRSESSCQASVSLFLETSSLFLSGNLSLKNWKEETLVDLAYAFAKAKQMNSDIADAIGFAIINRNQVLLDASQLGDLAVAFNSSKAASSEHILKMTFKKFESIDSSEIKLQAVAGVSSAIPLGQEIQAVPPGFVNALVELAIEKSNECRPEDVLDILRSFSRIGLEQKLQEKLLTEFASAVVPIIHIFNAQDLAKIVNAFAEMNHYNSSLFDEAASAGVPIIHTFNAQDLSTMMNAFVKMKHPDPGLFDKIADALLPVIQAFEAQSLVNTVNAFASVNHFHPKLFEEVAKVSIRILDTFNSQTLSSMMIAFSQRRDSSEASDRLFFDVSSVITSGKVPLSSWEIVNIVELAYAFKKGSLMNKDLLEAIGSEIINRDKVVLDARDLGKLAASFSQSETQSSAGVLEMIFQSFYFLEKSKIELRAVVDISSAISLGQRLKVVPPGFVKLLVQLAIEKSGESCPEDIRDMMSRFSKIDLEQKLLHKLLVEYRPIFDKFFKKKNSE